MSKYTDSIEPILLSVTQVARLIGFGRTKTYRLNPGDKSEALLALLQECAEHAVEAVHFLVAEYLWGIMT